MRVKPAGVQRSGARVARSLPAALVMALAASGCMVSGGVVPVGGQGGVPAGPLMAVVDDPQGGPPIECRGVPRDHCLEAGHVDPAAPGPPDGDVVRVIVTCTAKPVCTPQKGEYRIDALLPNGTTVDVGQGGYATAGGP